MNTRLVAYRPAVSTDTQDTTYQLDLQESPNIAVNFKVDVYKKLEKEITSLKLN